MDAKANARYYRGMKIAFNYLSVYLFLAPVKQIFTWIVNHTTELVKCPNILFHHLTVNSTAFLKARMKPVIR